MSAAGRWIRRRLGMWPVGPISAMSDSDLGSLARRTMAMLDDTGDQKGIKRIAATSAGLFLIQTAIAQNASRMTVNLGGATVDGKNAGDWTVLVLRPDEPIFDGDAEEPPVTLRGWLRPGMADQAIGAFERLTECVGTVSEEAA